MSSQEWKKSNYNKNIKVSQSVVDSLKKRSKSENIKLANRADASPQFKEAVRRFYGKPVTGTTRPTGKIAPRSRGGATTASKSSTVKPATKSGSTSNKGKGSNFMSSTVTPESYKMNVGKDNLTPAQRREIASKQGTGDKIIGGLAQIAVPGTVGFKALKASKTAASVMRGGRAMEILKGQKAIAKTAKNKATRLQNAAEAAKQQKARSEAAKRAAATRAKNAKKR